MHGKNKHEFDWPSTALEILEQAASIIAEKFRREDNLSSPEASKQYLTYKLAGFDREVFSVLLLDNQNQLIEYKELFFGTINNTTVYPREIIKAVLDVNAAAVIFAHNHPSGESKPSSDDIALTKTLSQILKQIDVLVVDHIVIGKEAYSFAENGLL